MKDMNLKLMFKNGYGISIICNVASYGHEDGLFEIAVLDKNGNLVYDTLITNDVLGYLTDEEVVEIINQVKNLPDRKE